jgi:hypothetical protein
MTETKADPVVKEIRARAAQGMSLASGANRGDWLYAAAVLAFGSWGKAVGVADPIDTLTWYHPLPAGSITGVLA